MSIVCFEIAPDYREKGIATELVKHILKEAKDNGYDAVEGYAEIRKDMIYNDFYGPYNLYIKLGFMEIETCDNKAIMRYVFS